MRFLRQSTASQEILLGPFVAAADGSSQTGLTIANTDIKLLYAGGTSENNKNSGGGTHIAGGRYSAVLDATDTATVGILEVSCNPASGIPWNKSYYVLEEAVYDALFAASALGYVANAPVNVAQFGGSNGTFASGRPEVNTSHAAGTAWNSGAIGASTLASDTIAAAKIAAGAITNAKFAAGAIDATAIADNAIDAGAIASSAIALAKLATDTRNALGLNLTGTLSGTHSDTTADLGTSAPTEDVSGQTVFFPAHQLSRVITAYNTGTGVATFDSIGVTLANSDVWYLFPTAPSSGGGGGGDATEANQDIIIAELAKVPKSDSNVTWNATAAAQIQNEAQDAITASALATAAELAKVPKSDGTATWNATALASMQQEATDALNAYDPPTRAEATSDANSILTAVGDVPTNAELATALGTADDAVLAAIAALNNVSVANILGATVEGSTTLVQSLRLLNAALGGKASGLETTTAVYRDVGDSKDRITATVDADGNRSAVTLDLT